MKNVFFAVAAILVVASSAPALAQTAKLTCVSPDDSILYYDMGGVIRFEAQVDAEDQLSGAGLTTTGSDVLGTGPETLSGRTTRSYVRFVTADAWCVYRWALPRGFSTRERTRLFLDAQCEENTNSSHVLTCKVQH